MATTPPRLTLLTAPNNTIYMLLLDGRGSAL